MWFESFPFLIGGQCCIFKFKVLLKKERVTFVLPSVYCPAVLECRDMIDMFTAISSAGWDLWGCGSCSYKRWVNEKTPTRKGKKRMCCFAFTAPVSYVILILDVFGWISYKKHHLRWLLRKELTALTQPTKKKNCFCPHVTLRLWG